MQVKYVGTEYTGRSFICLRSFGPSDLRSWYPVKVSQGDTVTEIEYEVIDKFEIVLCIKKFPAVDRLDKCND